MARGLDKDSGGGSLSRKNSQNLYTLSNSEIKEFKKIKEAFKSNKKVFYQNTQGEKAKSFWREIAAQEKLPYSEVDFSDFQKKVKTYTKNPGVWAVNVFEKDSKGLMDLSKDLQNIYSNEGSFSKDSYITFFDQGAEPEGKIFDFEKAAAFDWEDKGQDYYISEQTLEAFKKVKKELANKKRAFIQTAPNKKAVEEKADFWREVAANEKLPFSNISSKEAKEWISANGSWNSDLKNPGVFNIEVDNKSDKDALATLINEIASDSQGKGKINKEAIINIIDSSKDKSEENRLPQSLLDRLTSLD